MVLSRRFLLGSLLATPTVNKVRPVPKYVADHQVHGYNCLDDAKRNSWKELAVKLSVAETVMKETKLFYIGMCESEKMTGEIKGHFTKVEELSNLYEQYEPLVKQMRIDAKEMMLFNDCYNA
jgi:hypothetical protein